MTAFAPTMLSFAALAGFAAARWLPAAIFGILLSLALYIPGWFLIAPGFETEIAQIIRNLLARIAWLAWGMPLMCVLVGLMLRAHRTRPAPVD